VLLMLAALTMAASATGCGPRVFRVHQLTHDMLAPPVENAHTIDLSRLATFSGSSEAIDQGDILEVTITTGYENNYTRNGPQIFPIRVGDDGTANVPLVGKVPLAGLELEEAEHAIAAAAIERGIFNAPHVTVAMRRQRVNRVTVLGAVKTEGVYPLPRRGSWLLAAIVAAGGLNEDASTEVIIRSPAPGGAARDALASHVRDAADAAAPTEVRRVDLIEAVRDARGGFYLEDGAYVEVLRRDFRPVSVLGLVVKPGKYSLPVSQDVYLLDVLAEAGGLGSPVADKIRIIRRLPHRPEPFVIQVGYGEAKKNPAANLRLAEGDIVTVEQTPATVMHDTLRSFIRFGFNSPIPLF
jgi:polysaccharide biosynthesis/export protein